MTFFINYLSLRQALTPDRLLGRVTATMITLTVAAAPLGGLLGGFIGEHLGLRYAVAFAGAGAVLLAPLLAWRSPIALLRDYHATDILGPYRGGARLMAFDHS